MKKIIFLVVATILATAFVACQKDNDNENGNNRDDQITTTIRTWSDASSIFFEASGIGTMTINWGDETTIETYPLSSKRLEYFHKYSNIGGSSYSIKISGNITHMGWDSEYAELTYINIGKKITTLSYLDVSYHSLSDGALNSLFESLHDKTISGGKIVYIRSNPGTKSCDRSIAEKKGWTVSTNYPENW